MTPTTAQVLTRLRSAIEDGAFPDVCDEVIEEFDGVPDRADAIEPILRLMESNPAADFGTPGPLVHWLEGFTGSGYEEKLVESLTRRPTTHTVWMLNRCINGAVGGEKERLIAIMSDIARRPGLDAQVAAHATEFLEYHADR